MQVKNHIVAGICAVAVLTSLASCSVYDRAASYVDEPVVRDVSVGMSKQQVDSIAGQPATTINLMNANGTCNTYLINGTSNKPQAYFVSFDTRGKVMNKGYQTCADYDKKI